MSLIKQSAFVSLARIADKVLSFIVVWNLSRRFGEAGLGQFNYYFSLLCLFLPLMDMGFGMIMMQRWHDRDVQGRRLLYTQVLILRMATGIAALLLAMSVDFISHGFAFNPWAVMAAFFAIFFDDISDVLRKPAHAQGKIWIEALCPLISRVIQLALLLWLLKDMTDGFQVIYIYTFANAIEMIASCYGSKGYAPTTLKGSKPTDWWDILKNGAPFAMSGFFVMASLHFDTVILNHFHGDKAVGLFTAATRLLAVLNVLNGGVCHALFPKLIKAKADSDPVHAGWLVNGTLRGFIILFGGFAIGGVCVGQGLMESVWGKNFAESGLVFRILSPLILFSALYSLLGQTLEILGEQAKVMRVYAVTAVINIVGNIVLIPMFGIYGSAFTTMISTLYTVVVLTICVFQNPHVRMTTFGLGRAVFFLFLLTLAYMPLSSMSVYAAIPLGALIFAVILIPLREYWFANMGRLAGNCGYCARIKKTSALEPVSN